MEKGIKKGPEENFGYDRYGCYLDFGDGFMDVLVYLCQCIKLYTFKICDYCISIIFQ